MLPRLDERAAVRVAGDDGGLCGVAALEQPLARGQVEAAAALALGMALEAMRVQEGPDLLLEEFEVGRGKVSGAGTAGESGKNGEGGANAKGSFHHSRLGCRMIVKTAGGGWERGSGRHPC